MVIQRIQSVYLLLAALLLAALSFCVPIGSVADSLADTHQLIYVKDSVALLTLALVTAVLLFVDIFLFKNLRVQMRVASVCIFMILALACEGAFILGMRMPEGSEVAWLGPALVLAASLILAIFAHRGMKADQRLLKSYDRIR